MGSSTACDPRAFLGRLRTVTDMLSWSAEDQLAYLDGIGVPGLVDELALLFDDSMATVPALSEDGLLCAEANRALQKIDDALGRMSGPQGPWDAESLATAPDWTTVRELARAATGQLPAGAPP